MSKEKKVRIHGIEFTFQELSIVEQLKICSSYQEVGKNLSISIKTVEYYVKNLKKKTRANSKEELIRFFETAEKEKLLQKIKRRCLNLINNRKFLQILVLLLIVIMAVLVLFYLGKDKGTKEKNDTITNVLQFTDNFLNRPYIERQIIERLEKQKGVKVAVICGTGGAGKTTISRKVLSSIKGSIKFEINAETLETLYNSFMELADYVSKTAEHRRELDVIRNLKSPEHRKRSLIRFTANRLKQSGSWVLLLDNVGTFEDIKEYFPMEEVWGPGIVLITTMNQSLEESSFIKREWIINIGRLQEQERKELFTNISYGCEFENLSGDDKKLVEKFLASIPEFPLDVCAAAYFVKNTKVTPEEYKKIMKESLKALSEQQKKLMKENASYGETRYGIVSSVFKEILQGKDEFKQLLLVLCLMDSQNIPKYVLKNTSGVISANNFIRKLKEHSLITDNVSDISIHRASHDIGYSYILENLSNEELVNGIHILTNVLSKDENKELRLPHLESVLTKVSNIKSAGLEEDESKLLILIGDIFRNQTYRINDALKCFEDVLQLNRENSCLDEHTLAQVKLRIGEVCTIMNKNTQAGKYLNESINCLEGMEKVKCFRLLGIVQMRQHQFEEANNYFMSALDLLKNVRADEVKKRLSESNIYEDMSFNYFMDGINRENAKKAVPLMEKAIEVLEDPRLADIEEVISRKAVHKIKLAGIHNALAHYQKALEIAQETEDLIASRFDTADIFYVKGIIARERGLSYLRLNEVSKAYDYFETARKIFEKLMKGDYLFKLKTHEAECFVRMNRLDEAMKKCEEMFAEKERERNNYTDLFLNTSYYHAAVIKFKQKDLRTSREYFQKFVKAMKDFGKVMFSPNMYQELDHQRVFDTSKSTEEFFENSLKIFEAVYWKDYEFTKYYVEENLQEAKSN